MKIKNNMTWLEMICGTLLIIIIFVILPGMAGHIQTNYERKECVVTCIINDEITVEDKNGYIWSFYTDNYNDLKINDIVTLKMHTNFTDNTIEDDYVVGIK